MQKMNTNVKRSCVRLLTGSATTWTNAYLAVDKSGKIVLSSLGSLHDLAVPLTGNLSILLQN